MEDIRKGTHSVHQMHVHLVWTTKYRYSVLQGEVQIRCRDLIRQICDALDVRILKGVVSKDHVHLYLSYPPKLGYGAWSTGNITDEMVEDYLNHHKDGPNSDQNFILE